MDLNFSNSNFLVSSGFTKPSSEKLYDVIIVGGGPAGFTAALYCLRKGISVSVIAKDFGGKVTDTHLIENFTGILSVSGNEFANTLKKQLLQFPLEMENDSSVVSISNSEKNKIVQLNDGRILKTKSIIIATGTINRRLGISGEAEFSGKGVSYCAICDAPFFKNKKVIVVGGGNSAADAVNDLAKIAEHVTLVHYRDKLRADKVLVDKIKEYSNLNFLFNHRLVQINGKDNVEEVLVENIETGNKSEIKTDGVFIEIGLIPNTEFLSGLLELNSAKEIIVDAHAQTSIQGIFAAGDVTNVPFKQIVIAAGEGAKAALSACEYISKLN